MFALYAISVILSLSVSPSQGNLNCNSDSCRYQVVCDNVESPSSGLHPPRCPQTTFNFPGGQQKTDYIRVKASIPQMRELSICAWLMPISGQSLTGAFASYSTPRMDNAFLVAFEKGNELHLWYNQQFNKRPLRLTTRTHFCIVLATAIGNTKVYLNGQLFATHTFGNERNLIEGGGGFILGQEQDAYLGGFDAAQSFAGMVENFMMWNRVLSGDEITSLYQDKCACPKHHALHLALHEVQLYGKVTAHSSEDCP